MNHDDGNILQCDYNTSCIIHSIRLMKYKPWSYKWCQLRNDHKAIQKKNIPTGFLRVIDKLLVKFRKLLWDFLILV